MKNIDKIHVLYGKSDFQEKVINIPAEILEYSDELEITDDEFCFLCHIFYLLGSNISKTEIEKHINKLSAYSKEIETLQNKGYLKISKEKEIIYDISNLKRKIEELKINKK